MANYNLDLLSPNLILILKTAAQSDSLNKYLYYDVEQPTLQPSLADRNILLMNKMWPMRFDEQIEIEDCSQLRVYYLNGDFANDMVVSEMNVVFDIIVAKSLWLINESDGSSSVRPYSIANELIKQFRNKSVGTVGKLLFKNFRHIAVNNKFDGIRLVAKMTGFSGG